MSRRGDEFKHRTTIFVRTLLAGSTHLACFRSPVDPFSPIILGFCRLAILIILFPFFSILLLQEGAFRAWSHLGGLDPEILETKTVQELDPITFVLENDSRLEHKTAPPKAGTNDDGSVRREFAYETLPRSGILHPFVKAILKQYLGPSADKEALEFGLATLRTWWQHRRKGENKTSIKILGTGEMQEVLDNYTRHYFELAHCLVIGDKVEAPRTLKKKMDNLEKRRRVQAKEENGELSPLERMYSYSARVQHGISPSPSSSLSDSAIHLKGKCDAGSINLPGVVGDVNRKATLLAHRGMGGSKQDDDGKMPLVFVSANGDCQILLHIDGITCAHCVKIVETVLKGCNGKSGIAGLLDAAADRDMNCVLIKIDNPSNAKRIAFESKRNLALVGYSAKPKEVELSNGDLSVFSAPSHHQMTFLDWNADCTCPESGIFRMNCGLHGQMNQYFANNLSIRETEVMAFLQGPMHGAAHGEDDHEPIPLGQHDASEPIPLAQYEQQRAFFRGGSTHHQELPYDWEPLDTGLNYGHMDHSAS